MARMKVEFEGFDEVMKKLKHLDADVHNITDKALRETHRIVTDKAEQAMAGHNLTGQTIGSLRTDAEIIWRGEVAEVPVGFDIKAGGLASIFLMYGTPRHGPYGRTPGARGGHPGTQAVRELYNAFYGAGTRNEVRTAQEQIFYAALRGLE